MSWLLSPCCIGHAPPPLKAPKSLYVGCSVAIAFGSAPQREANSQPISQSVRQAVSQAVSRGSRQADKTENTVWVFSVADSATSSGELHT